MSTNDPIENTQSHSASAQQFLEKIIQTLDDHKAEDIVTIDLTQKSTMGEYMVVASGTSNRHLQSLAWYVQDEAAKMGVKGIQPEGLTESDWVLLDLQNVIVHLFRPETRALYDLEGMWSTFDKPSKSVNDLHAQHHSQ